MTPWRGGGLVGAGTCPDLRTVGYEWYYNWSSFPSCPKSPVPFVPMVKAPSQSMPDNLTGGPRQYLLTFNEPDAAGLTVARALELWPRLEATRRQLSSPAVTYTTQGRKWLVTFMAAAASKGYRIDFIAAHWYGTDPRNLVGYLNQLHAKFGLPVWLTEFCCYGGSLAANTKFAETVGPLLAALPYLHRVGWFANRSVKGGYEGAGLVDPSGELTPVGTAYKTWEKP